MSEKPTNESAPEIRIKVNKRGVPPGEVLIEDAASLTAGLRDSLARIVQLRLGRPVATKLQDEAKDLTQITLFGVFEGSGILACHALEVPGVEGRTPAMLAAVELVSGIRHYTSTRTWPKYLPWVVRNRLGSAIAPIVHGDTTVDLVVDEGSSTTSCHIDNEVRSALLAPKVVEDTSPVNLVGKIFDINVKNRTFKIDVDIKRVTVPYEEPRHEQVDSLRWKRVFVNGKPEDDRLKALATLVELRAADDSELSGVFVPQAELAAQAGMAYQQSAARLAELRRLPANWNSYGAIPPKPIVLDFAETFINDLSRVFLDYSMDAPVPFLVPTPLGGVQFEWQQGERELELEIPTPNVFHFLQVKEDGTAQEGTASRWRAFRLVNWLATGERE